MPPVIATVPVGYDDGYPRTAEGAEVLIRGVRRPVVLTVLCLAVALMVSSMGMAVLLIGLLLATMVVLRVASVARSTGGLG